MPVDPEAPPPLQALLDAFNTHDLDAIMAFFTEDCVFDTPRGSAPGGRRLVGREAVRAGFRARFEGIPDIAYEDARHWTAGDRGVSEWTIRGTQASGAPIEVRGCDLFEFTHGKVSRKDSFWKLVE
ncbi:MAG: putative snoaL-like polyketide cyclase [Solirubrobacterales bacterium]|jgi:ketosteroid isomerase-like protein|nr:putative snoaL-like polyketide cyclase [Solirubrobacterales bacterium]